MENEIWKDIPGYEELYQVSNLGNIKSLDRKVLKSNGIYINFKSKILVQIIDKDGYCRVNLSKNGKIKNFLVHALVAYAFLNHSPCRYKLIVDHIDDIKSNNKSYNLQIITQRKNTSKDRFRFDYSSNKLGVSWCKQTKKWRASIYVNGKNKHLGRFDDENQASEAYQKALKLHNKMIICD